MAGLSKQKAVKNTHRTWGEVMIEHLADPEQARLYLEVAIEEYEEDGDKAAFLIALRNVAEAQGGIRQLAQRSDLNREHLYRILSNRGNPRLDTIGKILHGLGFRLSVKHAESA